MFLISTSLRMKMKGNEILLYQYELESSEFSRLHCSNIRRESDLRNVSYNRPVCVRSFVKNVKSLSENQQNACAVVVT